MAKREEPPILMHRRGSMLYPHGPLDASAIESFDAGKPLRVRVTQPRNVGRHRFYWAMLALICDNLEDAPSTETLHQVVKVMLGYTRTVKTAAGAVTIPRSIAFDAMSEPEFRAFLEAFKTLVATKIIPGLGLPAFEKAAREMMGDYSDPSALVRGEAA